eukprot:1161295-Pelagomonas_calceolata.AAC.18
MAVIKKKTVSSYNSYQCKATQHGHLTRGQSHSCGCMLGPLEIAELLRSQPHSQIRPYQIFNEQASIGAQLNGTCRCKECSSTREDGAIRKTIVFSKHLNHP